MAETGSAGRERARAQLTDIGCCLGKPVGPAGPGRDEKAQWPAEHQLFPGVKGVEFAKRALSDLFLNGDYEYEAPRKAQLAHRRLLLRMN